MSDPLLPAIERAIVDHGCVGTGHSMAAAIRDAIAPLMRRPAAESVRQVREAFAAYIEREYGPNDGTHWSDDDTPCCAQDESVVDLSDEWHIWRAAVASTQPPAGDEVGEDDLDARAERLWRAFFGVEADFGDGRWNVVRGEEREGWYRVATCAESTRANEAPR